MYVYCEQPLCGCVRCISMLSSPALSLSLSLSLPLELQLPALLARVEGREGGRQTHSVVI